MCVGRTLHCVCVRMPWEVVNLLKWQQHENTWSVLLALLWPLTCCILRTHHHIFQVHSLYCLPFPKTAPLSAQRPCPFTSSQISLTPLPTAHRETRILSEFPWVFFFPRFKGFMPASSLSLILKNWGSEKLRNSIRRQHLGAPEGPVRWACL